MVAKEKTTPAAVKAADGMMIFTRPGRGKGRLAMQLSHASIIEEDLALLGVQEGMFAYFAEVNGIRHSFTSELTLEELAGASVPEETA